MLPLSDLPDELFMAIMAHMIRAGRTTAPRMCRTGKCERSAILRSVDVAISSVMGVDIHEARNFVVSLQCAVRLFDYLRSRADAQALPSSFQTWNNIKERCQVMREALNRHVGARDILLRVEAAEVNSSLPAGFSATVAPPKSFPGYEQKSFDLVCTVPGIDGTLHDGAVYTLSVHLPITTVRLPSPGRSTGYAPVVFVEELHSVFHMQIYGRHGRMRLFLSEFWSASSSLAELLLNAQVLLHSHNVQDPACEIPYRLATARPLGGPGSDHLPSNDYAEYRWRVRKMALARQAPSRSKALPERLVHAVLTCHLLQNAPYPQHQQLLLPHGRRIRLFQTDCVPFTWPGDVVDGELVDPRADPFAPPGEYCIGLGA